MDEEKPALRNRVTVKHLARDLGMSVSTVSRAFYPDAIIAAETRKAVLDHANKIGYRPNPFAQSLITKKSQIVGMVVSDLTNPFYPEVMTRLTGLMQQAGMNLMLAAADQPDKIDEAVELLLTYRPDLMIVLATNLASHAREKCEAAGAPVIFFNRLSADGLGFGVSCDNVEGGQACGGSSDRPRPPGTGLCVGVSRRLYQCRAARGFLQSCRRTRSCYPPDHRGRDVFL